MTARQNVCYNLHNVHEKLGLEYTVMIYVLYPKGSSCCAQRKRWRIFEVSQRLLIYGTIKLPWL